MNQNKFAIVFPGQGSQSVGMLAELAEHFSIVRDTFAEASNALGYDLWELVSNGPSERLNQTEITQPAMLAAGVATWRILCANTSARPHFLAGHSLGEYSALVAAEAVAFNDAVRLVQARARFMQGAMSAENSGVAAILGLDDAVVAEICANATDETGLVAPANYNARGQVVIAGHRTAVLKAMALAEERGAMMAKLIPVSTAVHTVLMQPAADKLNEELARTEFKVTKIPVIHNVDVMPSTTPETIRAALCRQVSHPVRWVETIESLHEQGITDVIECGPGKVLMKLTPRINRAVKSLAVVDLASLQDVIAKIEGKS